MKTLLLTLITASLTLSAFGQLTDYQRVRKISDLAEKKRYVLSLDRDDQLKLWRDHFAYVRINEDLNAEQAAFLARILDAFDQSEMTEEIEQEARELFDKELGSRVFNPGPFTCAAVSIVPKRMAFGFTAKRTFADCDCRQTGTNWSCNHCDPSNTCTPTNSGCSLLWAYPCDGKCSRFTKEGD